ncbi:MAG: multidrug efflux SMR transporter [Ectobacillus sp.]
MAWGYLVLAGMFEMSGVVLINKFNQDKSWQSFLMLAAGFGLSFFFLSLAMKELPMGTAYAIWTGIGAAGGAILGMALYKEPKDWQRLFFISLILVAVVGLKLIS